MLDDGALDGALPRAGVGDKTTMFCWTLAPVTHGIQPSSSMWLCTRRLKCRRPTSSAVGAGSPMVERGCPYQLNLVVDSSTAARCSALDTALDFNLGTMAPVCTAGAALWRPAAAMRP